MANLSPAQVKRLKALADAGKPPPPEPEQNDPADRHGQDWVTLGTMTFGVRIEGLKGDDKFGAYAGRIKDIIANAADSIEDDGDVWVAVWREA